MLCAGRKLVIL